MTVDLILLHPPTVYDFRKRSIMYGPISDLIPSTPVLEMYPVGFMSIAEHLERNGFSARIVNLAVKMLSDDGFDVERYIKSLDALAFGIDLHWLPHVHGGLEVARIIKNHHDRPVIFGGLSASYFHRELIGYDQVDFVVRGDSTEEPVLQLIKCLSKGMKPEDVPNLVYKDEGKVRVNPFTHVATDIDDIPMGYTNVVRSVVKYRDLEGYKPFKNWLSYPITSVLTCRGCTQNCVTCGGSCFAYGKSYNRKKTAFRSPSKVAEEVASISKLIKGPIFLVGDIRQPGKEHAQNVLKEIKKERIDNQIVVELFTPAPKGFLEDVARCIP
ncbi:MAG: cobalamin-dependent protein, partial [Thermoplasmata archaeon]|nr:cobalamin-dependent protein [Thermoplasmata archaeon]